jgi:hypothetical protein
MDPLSVLRFVFLVGGLVVLGTYLYLWRIYVTLYSDFEKRRVWALWFNGSYAMPWGLSVVLSTVGFCWFSVWLMQQPSEVCDAWVLAAYICFMLGAATYVPLLLFETGKLWVIFGLLVTAAAAINLSVWAFAHGADMTATVLVTWLGFHCAVLDLGLWGYTWYFEWHWAGPSDHPQLVQAMRLEDETKQWTPA